MFLWIGARVPRPSKIETSNLLLGKSVDIESPCEMGSDLMFSRGEELHVNFYMLMLPMKILSTLFCSAGYSIQGLYLLFEKMLMITFYFLCLKTLL